MSRQIVLVKVPSTTLQQLQAETLELQKYSSAQRSVIESLERRVGRSLQAIENHLSPIADSLQDHASWEMHLGLMQHEINSLCDLIADAMLLQKLEAGRVDVRIEPIDPYPLLESVTRHLLDSKDGSTTRLICEIAPALPSILADRELTEAVLTELLARSLKYSDSDFLVILAVDAVQDQVLLRVTAQRFAPQGDRDFATEVLLCCRQIEIQNGQVTCQHHANGLQTVVVTLPAA
jgi:signal transduction histidine kinase